MAGPVLYSTNPMFTELVCERFRGGRYRVWCSEVFDPASHGRHSPASLIVPSASPRMIYYGLLHAVRTSDSGDAKIRGYRETFENLANDWFSRGEIATEDRDDILALVERYPFKLWEPRLFVIPRERIEGSGRLNLVPAHRRSGIGLEYEIFDLHRDEFDAIVIEP